jgi:hypothetical protein
MIPKGFICIPFQIQFQKIVIYINVEHIILYKPKGNGTCIELELHAFDTPLTCEEVGKKIDEANMKKNGEA